MPAFWALCDISLIHLKNDKLFETVIPSKIFESMGMGLPMLMALPKGEASDLVLKHECGVWVEPENSRQLAESVLKLAKDDLLRRKLSEKSREASGEFTRENQARRMLRAIEYVVDGKANELSTLMAA